MDRNQLVNAHERFPRLQPVWQERRNRIEHERDRVVSALDNTAGTPRARDADRATAYRTLIRLDRSLSFLDRALLHLDDMAHRRHDAESIPLDLRPERYQ